MLAEEELRKQAEKENKITMRKALDDQVTEKQYRLNLEKHIDSEQGRSKFLYLFLCVTAR